MTDIIENPVIKLTRRLKCLSGTLNLLKLIKKSDFFKKSDFL